MQAVVLWNGYHGANLGSVSSDGETKLSEALNQYEATVLKIVHKRLMQSKYLLSNYWCYICMDETVRISVILPLSLLLFCSVKSLLLKPITALFLKIQVWCNEASFGSIKWFLVSWIEASEHLATIFRRKLELIRNKKLWVKILPNLGEFNRYNTELMLPRTPLKTRGCFSPVWCYFFI